LRLYGPDDGSTALSLARGLIRLVKTGRALKMKDAIDRRATLGALASVPALAALPAAAMTTPVDPILTAIARDRIAYVAFGASVNRTDEVKAAQEGHEVTQASEDAYEAAIGVEEDGAMN
jgi:hypothetical protein